METKTIIKLENANIYQKDLLVLKSVNFEVQTGDFVYLTGKTGSGKSSLLKTLYADLPLHEGQGHVADFDLTKTKRSKIPFLRRKIGVVFQDFLLLSDRDVYDNLSFVLKATGWKKGDIDQRITEVLDYVGMQEHIHKFPHQLSGGEQQRIAIARALLNHPMLILADEPTGNLDPETSDILMKLLLNVTEGGTAVIMATHNYTLIENYNGRVCRCEDQDLIEMTFRN